MSYYMVGSTVQVGDGAYMVKSHRPDELVLKRIEAGADQRSPLAKTLDREREEIRFLEKALVGSIELGNGQPEDHLLITLKHLYEGRLRRINRRIGELGLQAGPIPLTPADALAELRSEIEAHRREYVERQEKAPKPDQGRG